MAANPAARSHALDLRGRTLADDLSLVDDDDPMSQCIGLLEIVRRQQHRLAALGQRADLLPETAPRLNVHPDGRLIEEDQIGVATQRQTEEHALLLPSAQLAEHSVFDTLQLCDPHNLSHRQRARIVAAEEIEMLAHAKRLRDARHLQHRAHASPRRRVLRVAAKDSRDA